jgi:hypothetical protein
MDKRHLHHIWTRFRVLKPWYFLVLAAITGVIFIFAMRSNYSHMVTLRQAVYDADKSGQGVNEALNNLQKYVYAHMNTNLATKDGVYPPIQLKYTYDRLVQVQGDAAAAANSRLYTEAQHYCETQNSADFSGRNRVPCIENYVSSHTSAASANIPDSLYKFNFASPRWSPDMAGWSELLTIIFVLTAVGLFVLQRWFKHLVS